MGERIEWSEITDTPPRLAPAGEYTDERGTSNETWALASGGSVIEGSLEEWRTWARGLLVHIDQREQEVEEVETSYTITVRAKPGGSMVTVPATREGDNWDNYNWLVDGRAAEKIVDLWARNVKRTAEWFDEREAVLGWVADDGAPIVGRWSEYIDDDVYSIDDFPTGDLEIVTMLAQTVE